jgi:hypothetical protein
LTKLFCYFGRPIIVVDKNAKGQGKIIMIDRIKLFLHNESGATANEYALICSFDRLRDYS